jgi:hypothetical protein
MLRSLLVLVVVLLAPSAARAQDGVNAVLGDASYVARFGAPPGPEIDEDLRLRVHLEYVEQLLRAADTSHLTPDLQRARARNLDLLRAYHHRGVFPRNHRFPERRPHFIDEAGRICAVGYLIEQTAGRALAEAINAAHEWSYLWEMRGEALEAWIRTSGLTLLELAMIQPGYSHLRPPDEPSEPVETVRQTVLARIAAARGDVQACANAIGLEAAGRLRVIVTVAASGVLTPAIAGPGTEPFRSCARRVIDARLGRYPATERLRPMRVVGVISVEAAAGRPADREEISRRVHAAVLAHRGCVERGAMRVRLAAHPDGRLEVLHVATEGARVATACVVSAVGKLVHPGFRGERLELDVVVARPRHDGFARPPRR